jgi:hypothetical protein
MWLSTEENTMYHTQIFFGTWMVIINSLTGEWLCMLALMALAE